MKNNLIVALRPYVTGEMMVIEVETPPKKSRKSNPEHKKYHKRQKPDEDEEEMLEFIEDEEEEEEEQQTEVFAHKIVLERTLQRINWYVRGNFFICPFVRFPGHQ